jgi:hypothetical protein
MPHPWASLPTMGVLPYLIYASEALFAYVISPKRDMRNLRAIRMIDRSIGDDTSRPEALWIHSALDR